MCGCEAHRYSNVPCTCECDHGREKRTKKPESVKEFKDLPRTVEEEKLMNDRTVKCSCEGGGCGSPPARHHGVGSEECPRHLHHHHDEKCDPNYHYPHCDIVRSKEKSTGEQIDEIYEMSQEEVQKKLSEARQKLRGTGDPLGHEEKGGGNYIGTQ